MNNPEYVKIGAKRYKINTDFRVAIECNNIATSNNIGDLERTLAIIYKLFGDEGLNNQQDWEKLLELGIKFLCLGKELNDEQEEQDMDFNQDMDYIEASFMSDYRIDLSTTQMHWWKFFNLIEGLSNSDLGNCCVLNRIRNLRTYNVSQIKDPKERAKIIKAKNKVALNSKQNNTITTTEKQKNQDEFFSALEGGE